MNPSGLAAKAKLEVERARARSGFVDVTIRTFKRFSEDDGGPMAAALTYYTFFSIFPLLLLSASILGYITFGNEELRRALISKGVDAIPLVRDALDPGGLAVIQERRGSLALTGLGLALYSGTGAIVSLQHALNRIHRAKEEGTFLRKRLRALVWLAVIGSSAILSLGISAGGNVVAQAAGGNDAIVLVVSTTGGLAVGFLIFLTAFTILPQKRVTWRQAVPGAAVAAIAFEALKFGGTWFLARGETTRNDTFGTFAAAAALLIACFLISQITLVAGELNATLAERRATRQSSGSRSEDG